MPYNIGDLQGNPNLESYPYTVAGIHSIRVQGSIRVPYYIWDRKRDPDVENYPYLLQRLEARALTLKRQGLLKWAPGVQGSRVPGYAWAVFNIGASITSFFSYGGASKNNNNQVNTTIVAQNGSNDIPTSHHVDPGLRTLQFL